MILFAPGNIEREYKWTLDKLNKGFLEFKKRSDVKIVDRENFIIYVVVPNSP
jgi:hypothetical protein